jgi:hypothetical protein
MRYLFNHSLRPRLDRWRRMPIRQAGGREAADDFPGPTHLLRLGVDVG